MSTKKLVPYRDLEPQKGISYSREQIRRKVAAGTFPKPIPVGENRQAWIESELDQWIEELAAARDGGIAA